MEFNKEQKENVSQTLVCACQPTVPSEVPSEILPQFPKEKALLLYRSGIRHLQTWEQSKQDVKENLKGDIYDRTKCPRTPANNPSKSYAVKRSSRLTPLPCEPRKLLVAVHIENTYIKAIMDMGSSSSFLSKRSTKPFHNAADSCSIIFNIKVVNGPTRQVFKADYGTPRLGESPRNIKLSLTPSSFEDVVLGLKCFQDFTAPKSCTGKQKVRHKPVNICKVAAYTKSCSGVQMLCPVPVVTSQVAIATKPDITFNDVTQCSWISKRLVEMQSKPEEFPDYKWENGQLYRYFSNATPEDIKWKLCVPKPMRRRILQENHNQFAAVHLGLRKTAAKIHKKYFWPGMYRDIKRYVLKCESCQRYKASQRASRTRHGWYVYDVPERSLQQLIPLLERAASKIMPGQRCERIYFLREGSFRVSFLRNGQVHISTEHIGEREFVRVIM